jgi:polar amino acid transport system substrate-binding protein
VPEWLPGKFEWSQPFLPQVEVVISDRSVERPRALADLGGKAIGTVFGYSYPELERALGQGFSHDDGPSTELNLRKLSAGRLQHMVTMKSWIEYRQKQGGAVPALHPPLAVTTYNTRCALAPNGKVSLAEVERAVAQIIRDGTVAAIAARYK